MEPINKYKKQISQKRNKYIKQKKNKHKNKHKFVVIPKELETPKEL